MKIKDVKNFAIISTIMLTVSCCALMSCSTSKAKSEEAADAEIVYEASIVRKGKVTAQITLPGELEGYFETGIMAKVNGYIKKMLVDIGDKVQEGQLLAELEAPELVSQLISAYSEFQASNAIFLNTKGKFARLAQTNKTPGAVSPYDMDLARTNLTSDSLTYLASKAKYEAIRQLADYLKITAPFDGIITERALAPGAFVGPNDKQGIPILRLKKESKLRLHIAVPEKHLAEVSPGELVKFSVKSFPDESFEGRVTRLSKSLNVMTRSEITEIEIDNRNGKLLPGMYAVASLPIRRMGLSIIVPKTAVVTNMERQFVIKIINKNEATYVDVEKGEDQMEDVEVFGALTPGDTLLNAASDEIRQKSKIKIIIVDNIGPSQTRGKQIH
jgi:membrane fusion protein, multidrug efflux system